MLIHIMLCVQNICSIRIFTKHFHIFSAICLFILILCKHYLFISLLVVVIVQPSHFVYFINISFGISSRRCTPLYTPLSQRFGQRKRFATLAIFKWLSSRCLCAGVVQGVENVLGAAQCYQPLSLLSAAECAF